MSTSREAVRDALVTLLSAALVGAGLPAKTVIGSKVDPDGLTPLVTVLSAGSQRERLTMMGDKATFYLEVLVWVLQARTGWTNAQAEDAMDTIESLVAGVYEAARGTANWQTVEQDGRTTVIEVAVGGTSYYVERIPTVIRLARS